MTNHMANHPNRSMSLNGHPVELHQDRISGFWSVRTHVGHMTVNDLHGFWTRADALAAYRLRKTGHTARLTGYIARS